MVMAGFFCDCWRSGVRLSTQPRRKMSLRLCTWEAEADNLVRALLMAGRCHHLRPSVRPSLRQRASMLHRASHRDFAANVSQLSLPLLSLARALSHVRVMLEVTHISS